VEGIFRRRRQKSATSKYNRLLKNSVHPSTKLRANGEYIKNDYVFSVHAETVEAFQLFFNSLTRLAPA
jgi:hypothetical protein